MAVVIDRRGKGKGKLAGSRAKFIKRYKSYIREKINQHIDKSKLKDIDKGVDIDIRDLDTKEVRPKYNHIKSRWKSVHPGNTDHNKGDIIRTPKDEEGRSKGGSGEGVSTDEFKFILTKEEFLDILFKDLELPNFIKKDNKQMIKTTYVTGGYVKDGIPARLSIKKTLENAVARRIAAKGSKVAERFLDDIDLRYRNIIAEEKPISSAVMICCMDTSASMDENRKVLAKKFYLLLYLFLKKNYKQVEIRFISHHVRAKEVDEQQFFYGRESGGTIASSGIILADEIITKDYDINTTNIYIAQVSDGDNWTPDFEDLIPAVQNILPKVQYFAYIEVDNRYEDDGIAAWYKANISDKKMGYAVIHKDTDVIDALRGLFGDSNEKK